MPNPAPTSGLPGIGAIVAVSSAKGGVGKSTVTVNLAAALTRMGQRVGILDADILGPSIATMLGIDTRGGTQPGPSGKVVPPVAHGIKAMSMALFSGDDQPMMLRGPMVGKYLNLFLAGVEWGELDVLLLDLPPGTGDIQLNIAQSFPLAGAIVVTTPQAVSTSIARRGARMFETVKTPILGIVENMRGFECPTCGTTHALFGQGGGERLAGELGVPFLGALPIDPAILAAGDEGQPLADAGSDSAAAYEAIAGQLVAALGQGQAGLGPFRWIWADDTGAPRWDEGAVDARGPGEVPVGLRRADPHTLSILWRDGVQQELAVRDIRLSCGCALCRDELTGQPILDPATVPGDIRPVTLRNIGAYAVGIDWSDGHTSGIYPWASLRRLESRPADAVELHSPAQDLAPALEATPVDARSDETVLAVVRDFLDRRFNPALAAHRGEVRALDFVDGTLRVELRGGCQGCAASKLTLQQGLARQLKAVAPEVREIVDATDHAAGTRPYFA